MFTDNGLFVCFFFGLILLILIKFVDNILFLTRYRIICDMYKHLERVWGKLLEFLLNLPFFIMLYTCSFVSRYMHKKSCTIAIGIND